MININLTDHVVVIEPDPCRLDAAIRTALAEACEVIRAHYLPEVEVLPPIEARISQGKRQDQNKNGAHVVCHYLSPPPEVRLGENYVAAADQILCLPSMDFIPKDLISEIFFPSAEIAVRWTDQNHYRTVLRNALRVFLVSLLRQNAAILPPTTIERYLPRGKDGWKGYELMPVRLQEMAAVYFAGSGLEYGVDWSRCTYNWNGASIQEKGIENVPGKTGKRLLVCFAMCTRWERLGEIDPADIDELIQKFKSPSIISLYLTYLYLKEPDKELVAPKVFLWVDSIPWLRIYTEEFSVYAKKGRCRRSTAKRTVSGTNRTAIKERPEIVLKERVIDALAAATSGGSIDPHLLARNLGELRGRSTLVPTDRWPQKSLLPDSIPFEWQEQIAHWLQAFGLYARMTNYAEVDKEFSVFAPFMLYLSVYLPAYFHYNPDSAARYPSRVEDLNGSHFISRPGGDFSENLPLPYVEFVREYLRDTVQYRVYNAIRSLHRFFDQVLGRRELLGVPENFSNPVLETDIPGSGGRHAKTVKTRLPTDAYWLALVYAYKIYDWVATINEKCLADPFYADRYSVLYHNLDEDELGLVDIRDLLGDEADRAITFNGAAHEVTLVPSVFFQPAALPLKGKGERFVIRPHAITHLICTLETGIRNSHIQWLSDDFDKDVLSEEVIPEDVYRLFVMTDKSNKSWRALTAGRVIKVLREVRAFRGLVEAPSFDEKIHYEGRIENSPYPPFKAVFAFNQKTGFPHSDRVYEIGFRYLMVGLQGLLGHYGVDFRLYEVNDNAQERKDKIKLREGLTPHSMRVTVVGVHGEYLPPEYIGRYITNQKLACVHYYMKLDAKHLRELEEAQRRGVSQLSREESAIRLLGDSEAVMIDAAGPNSALARAFTEDPVQARVDFGAVSTHWFDRDTGLSILASNTKLNLAFEPTHICPYGRICPADRHKARLANRCNYCDYAIRTVDHLPAIASRVRDLNEELDRLEDFVRQNADKVTDAQERDVDERGSVLGMDIASLELTRRMLEEKLAALTRGDPTAASFHVYQPEAVLKKLEQMPFPDMADEARYVLARLAEVTAFPEPTQHTIRMKLMSFRNKILANTGNIREILKVGSDVRPVEAQVYSLVNSLKRVHNLSLDQIAEIASRDLAEMLQLEQRADFALLDSLDGVLSPSGTGTDG